MRVRHQNDNVEEIVAATIEAMEAVKGKDIVTLDLREITTAVTDYFVICHAPSKTQVDAIADKDSAKALEIVNGYKGPMLLPKSDRETWESIAKAGALKAAVEAAAAPAVRAVR